MSSASEIGGSLSVNRVPPPTTEAEREYRLAQKLKAACYMVKNRDQGQPDLVEVLGLDEVLTDEQRQGLGRLVAKWKKANLAKDGEV